MPPDEFEQFWNDDLPRRSVEARPTPIERVQAYCRRAGISPRPSVWDEVDDLLGCYADRALEAPRAEVLATIRTLREGGWTVGLLSNCDEREVRAWPRSPLASLFDAVVFSWEVGAAKPSRAAHDALVPRWGGVPLRDAAFVGDGHNRELPGARAAGFGRVVFQAQFVSVNGLRSAETLTALEAEADVTIWSVEGLVGLLGNAAAHG